MKHRIYVPAILLGILLLAATFSGCDSVETRAETGALEKDGAAMDGAVAKAVQVSVIEVKPAPIRDVLILPGEVLPSQDIRVSAGVGGQVGWMGAKEGKSVKQGELLVKINVPALKVGLDRAQAGFDLADKTYQRLKRLSDRGIITQENLDRAATERTLAEGNLNQIQVQYEEGFIHAPISGVVNKCYIDPGEFAGPGTPLLDIVNIDKMVIDLSVPEMDVRYLEVGQKALVRIDAFKERRLLGVITFVAFKADSRTKTFRTSVAIENAKRDIRAGMIARVALIRREVNDALVAPLSALVDKSGERLVFVEKDGIARARTISIGIIEQDRVQITKGLAVGDHLIVSGQNGLEEGMRVQVQ
ncbi:MAG: efflux RND transporter periplasmic adaptor subunit [Deltaproteobacteria bacterium]|nr:efflux RND transporter periplasmic adaptor subunit [Deltaproteobacteria bacterium]